MREKENLRNSAENLNAVFRKCGFFFKSKKVRNFFKFVESFLKFSHFFCWLKMLAKPLKIARISKKNHFKNSAIFTFTKNAQFKIE